MGSTFTVRRAVPEDKDWVIGIAAKRMLAEEVNRPDYYDQDACNQLFDAGLANGLVLVAEHNGKPVGCISGLYCPNPFNHKLKILQEIFWYVLPDERNGRAGLLLLNEFCSIGKSTADDIFMSLLDTSEVSQRMMTRKGFVRKEIAYAMKGNT